MRRAKRISRLLVLSGGQRGEQTVELGRVHVADSDQAEIADGDGAESEAGAGGIGWRYDVLLSDEDGDLVLACGEEKERGWMVCEPGEVGSLQGRAGRKCGRVREVKTEGQLALEPGLDRVAVGREHLRSGGS